MVDDTRPDRRTQRRLDTEAEILDRALEIMGEDGVAGLTVTRLAHEMRLKPPSLYRYYPSLLGIHDALFRRGQLANLAVVRDAISTVPPGLAAVSAAMTAAGRWAVDNPVLAQLLFWRPVPGFRPSADAFAPALEIVRLLRAALQQAADAGEVHPDAASDAGMDLLSVLHFGVLTQHLANDIDGTWTSGRYTSLHPHVLELFAAAYPADRAPRRRKPGPSR